MVLNCQNQQGGLRIDNSVCDFKWLGLSSDFSALEDSLIRYWILGAVLSNILRRELLKKPNLTLQQAHDYCRTFESSDLQNWGSGLTRSCFREFPKLLGAATIQLNITSYSVSIGRNVWIPTATHYHHGRKRLCSMWLIMSINKSDVTHWKWIVQLIEGMSLTWVDTRQNQTESGGVQTSKKDTFFSVAIAQFL